MVRAFGFDPKYVVSITTRPAKQGKTSVFMFLKKHSCARARDTRLCFLCGYK